jgi:four helix bundle protein
MPLLVTFPPTKGLGPQANCVDRRFLVASNIAEGSGRASNNEFVRFIEISYASLMELITQSTIARRQKILSPEDYQDVYERSEQIARMLSGLKSSLRHRD